MVHYPLELHRICALPTELQVMILRYTADEPTRLGAITECSIELSETLQFDLDYFRQHLSASRYPNQFKCILFTTIRIIVRAPVHSLTSLLYKNIEEKYDTDTWRENINDALSFQLYVKLRKEAHDLATRFAADTRRAAYNFFRRTDTGPSPLKTLSVTAEYRIQRACLHLQLYLHIYTAYSHRKSRSRKARSFFRTLAYWEFVELRSVVEWLKLKHSCISNNKDKDIDSFLQDTTFSKLFQPLPNAITGMVTFDHDILPLLRLDPADDSAMDRPRRHKFNILPKQWDDLPDVCGEFNTPTRHYYSIGHVFRGEYTKRVYHEVYLQQGWPFWIGSTMGTRRNPGGFFNSPPNVIEGELDHHCGDFWPVKDLIAVDVPARK